MSDRKKRRSSTTPTSVTSISVGCCRPRLLTGAIENWATVGTYRMLSDDGRSRPARSPPGPNRCVGSAGQSDGARGGATRPTEADPGAAPLAEPEASNERSDPSSDPVAGSLLRAVGATRRQMASSITGESVVITLLGTILGLVIGIAGGSAVMLAQSDEFDTLRIYVSPAFVIGVLVLVTLVTHAPFLFFGLLILWCVTRGPWGRARRRHYGWR